MDGGESGEVVLLAGCSRRARYCAKVARDELVGIFATLTYPLTDLGQKIKNGINTCFRCKNASEIVWNGSHQPQAELYRDYSPFLAEKYTEIETSR